MLTLFFLFDDRIDHEIQDTLMRRSDSSDEDSVLLASQPSSSRKVSEKELNTVDSKVIISEDNLLESVKVVASNSAGGPANGESSST